MLRHLFTPLALGPAELRNRIVSTAHQTNLVHDHLPTDDFIAYHEARARGGVGLIVLEATAVHESGLLTAHTLAGYRDEIADGYRRVADAVHAHGTRVVVQLFHGGREQIASPPRPPALAPSAVPTQRFHVEPRALAEVEIASIVAGYGRAAELARTGGLDGVEISAAHNYLIAQFFTPELNRREDAYAEPARLLLEVLETVRGAADGLAVGVRLSADSDAARAVAPAVAGRADYVSLALGESSTYRGSTGIVPPPPVVENAIARWAPRFRVTGLPLIATSRVVDPTEGDRLVADGVADAVGMTRALITDPELPQKAADGRLEDIVRCIGCNACIAHYHAGTPLACTQNPRTGRERRLPAPGLAGDRRRVVVVGAGPAGLAAAVEAGTAGHEVVLVERAQRIGGQTSLAGAAPAHAETARTLRANYERLLASAGVDVRLANDVSAEDVLALTPDAVVVATGARPYEPELPLADLEVVQAWDVLARPPVRGRRVVVADWGGDPSGLDCAELLTAAGNDVVLALASAAIGETLHQYQRNLYAERLYRAGVRIEQHLELVEARGGRVSFGNIFARDLDTSLAADMLVLALGRVPERGVATAVRAGGVPVEEAGDCLSPRGMEEAILEGTLAARRIGAPVG